MTAEAEILRRARENFVRKRRALAEQMIPSGAAASHFAPAFSEIQAAIEAIDRAIADEEDLPEGYGDAGEDASSPVELATVDGKPVERDGEPA